MVFVVARYAGAAGYNQTYMLQQVDQTIRVTQNTNDAAAFGLGAARIFEKLLIYNVTGFDAVTMAAAEMVDPSRNGPQYPEDADLAAGLQRALAAVGQSNMAFVMAEGQSCDYPHNLITGAHLIAQLGGSANDYVNGTRLTIMAGGDSGSRNVFVGAAQSAKMGDYNLIPTAWTAQTGIWSTVLPLSAQLVGHR